MNEHKVSDMALAVGSVSASVARGPVASAIPLTGRSSMVSRDRMIAVRQALELRSAKAIPHLAVDLKNELPEQKGFSEQNIKPMLRFHREYPSLILSAETKVPQPAAQLTDLESEAAGSTRVTGQIVAMNEHNVSDVALAVGSVSGSFACGPVASAIPLTRTFHLEVSLDCPGAGHGDRTMNVTRSNSRTPGCTAKIGVMSL